MNEKLKEETNLFEKFVSKNNLKVEDLERLNKIIRTFNKDLKNFFSETKLSPDIIRELRSIIILKSSESDDNEKE